MNTVLSNTIVATIVLDCGYDENRRLPLAVSQEVNPVFIQSNV